MISRALGLVLKIKEQREGLTEIKVEVAGHNYPAINFDDLTGSVNVGDKVLLNTTAVDLGLGTGGSHFVMANLSCPTKEGRAEGTQSEDIQSDEISAGCIPLEEITPKEVQSEGAEPVRTSGAQPGADKPGDVQPKKGHIMKLRYTPNQLRVLAVEEEDSPYHKSLKESYSLEGVPVVCCSLHSMLPPAAAAVKAFERDLRVIYVMTDGAALPLSLSRLVHTLKKEGLIDGTVTVGHAFGGDLEAVNVYSGLLAAKTVLKADVVIIGMGPGIVGTGTPFGFTGIEQAQLIHAVFSLEGFPIAVPRLGFADSRKRHRGLSHHSKTTLGQAVLVPVHVAFPVMEPDKQKIILQQMQENGITSRHRLVVDEGASGLALLEKHGIRVTTMGRSPVEEPEYFLAASCAGTIAAKVCMGEQLELWEED